VRAEIRKFGGVLEKGEFLNRGGKSRSTAPQNNRVKASNRKKNGYGLIKGAKNGAPSTLQDETTHDENHILEHGEQIIVSNRGTKDRPTLGLKPHASGRKKAAPASRQAPIPSWQLTLGSNVLATGSFIYKIEVHLKCPEPARSSANVLCQLSPFTSIAFWISSLPPGLGESRARPSPPKQAIPSVIGNASNKPAKRGHV